MTSRSPVYLSTREAGQRFSPAKSPKAFVAWMKRHGLTWALHRVGRSQWTIRDVDLDQLLQKGA